MLSVYQHTHPLDVWVGPQRPQRRDRPHLRGGHTLCVDVSEMFLRNTRSRIGCSVASKVGWRGAQWLGLVGFPMDRGPYEAFQSCREIVDRAESPGAGTRQWRVVSRADVCGALCGWWWWHSQVAAPNRPVQAISRVDRLVV